MLGWGLGGEGGGGSGNRASRSTAQRYFKNPVAAGRVTFLTVGKRAELMEEKAWGLGFGRLSGRAGGEGLAGGLVGGRSCSHARLLARSTLGGSRSRSRVPRHMGPRRPAEDFVGLTGLAAPALLGWGLRVTVCAWSVSLWFGSL